MWKTKSQTVSLTKSVQLYSFGWSSSEGKTSHILISDWKWFIRQFSLSNTKNEPNVYWHNVHRNFQWEEETRKARKRWRWGRQFFSSYCHCRRCKNKSLEHQSDQILLSALQLREIKAKEDSLVALVRIQVGHALDIFIFPSTVITNAFSCK